MSSRDRRLHYVFSFTSHGFGHLTRTLRVLDRFLELFPHVDATVCAEAPEWLVAQRVRRSVAQRRVTYEPGTAQKNCFEVDEAATRESYRQFVEERPRRLEIEREFLRESAACGLVVDIPALPVRAAKELGLPVAGVSNFTWDWILGPTIDEDHLEILRSDYELGDLFLSLPFGPGSSPFRETEHAPLVAPSSALPRDQALKRVGLDPAIDRPVVLVCIGGWGGSDWPAICVSGCTDLQFIVVGELPVDTHGPMLRLGDSVGGGVDVSDLVAAADAVVTKPGYGITSECVAHQTPVVGIERRGFCEFDELVRGLKEYGVFEPLSLEDFFAGFWERPIRAALTDRRDWKPAPADGARDVALRLGELFGLEQEEGTHRPSDSRANRRRAAGSGEKT